MNGTPASSSDRIADATMSLFASAPFRAVLALLLSATVVIAVLLNPAPQAPATPRAIAERPVETPVPSSSSTSSDGY